MFMNQFVGFVLLFGWIQYEFSRSLGGETSNLRMWFGLVCFDLSLSFSLLCLVVLVDRS